jgi:hypothetical protein
MKNYCACSMPLPKNIIEDKNLHFELHRDDINQFEERMVFSFPVCLKLGFLNTPCTPNVAE